MTRLTIRSRHVTCSGIWSAEGWTPPVKEALPSVANTWQAFSYGKPTKTSHSFEIEKKVVKRFIAGESGMDLADEFNDFGVELGECMAMRRG